MLSYTEIQKVLQSLPILELSYDKIIHKKVHADIYQVIPYGLKYIAWFTKYKSDTLCVFIEIKNRKLKLDTAFNLPVCFNDSIACNSILYGTMISNKKFFIVENIYYHKNVNVTRYTYSDKFKLFRSIFKNEIKQVSYTDTTVVFTLPMSDMSYTELCKNCTSLPYDIYSISYIQGTLSYKCCMKFTKNKDNVYPFLVKPDILNDIYTLYYTDDVSNENVSYELACIPDYKTSVFMNGLFRQIKENICLDALEESDDEEEFECINIDKHVDLQKTYILDCMYNTRFKMWVPFRISKSPVSVKKSEVLNLCT